MEVMKDLNELLTVKMCSPVIVYMVVLVVSILSVYLCRERLKRYRTSKMDNLANMFTMQEVKFMIVLGVIMYGLCQYNKTELAWIFLIFPIIYVMIQNVLLYIHVSSAVQSAPQPQPSVSYGNGMSPPLLGGPSTPQQTQPLQAGPPPVIPKDEYTLPKLTSQSTSMGTGSGMGVSGFNI